MGTLVLDQTGKPVEIARGRGDLRFTSQPTYASWAASSVLLAGNRRISYSRLFADQPMIGAAVMWLLAESVRVPLKVYRRTGDDSRVRLRADEHPLAAAVAEPWERACSAQLDMALLGSLSVHGNSLMEIDQGARNQIRFLPADYRYAKPIMPWRDTIAGWDLDSDEPTMRRTVGADTVLHVAWWSPFGPLGVSPLQQLGVTLNIEDAAQRHQKSMFRNSARPPSAVTTAPEFLGLDVEERTALMEQLRDDIEDLYAGPDNAGRPAILPPGLDWKQVGHTAVEAQLVEQRHVSRQEIGAIYRIMPGSFGFGLERGGATLPDQRQMSYLDGLAPPLIYIEQSINSQVVRALLREDDIFVEHDFAGILRGDRLKEIEALREAIATALMTPNEGRAVINMPQSPLKQMDEFYLPFNNLWPISQDPPKSGARGLEQAMAALAAHAAANPAPSTAEDPAADELAVT